MVGLACADRAAARRRRRHLPGRARRRPLGHAVRFTAEVLAGVPSIVIGVVAYGLIVVPMRHFSALAGAVALAILMIPTLARTTEEMVRLVPRSLREASLALGVPAWKTSLSVVLRTALGGTRQRRAAGGRARRRRDGAAALHRAQQPVLERRIPLQPTASLTVQIFNYAISPYDDWHDKAWGAALLTLLAAHRSRSASVAKLRDLSAEQPT